MKEQMNKHRIAQINKGIDEQINGKGRKEEVRNKYGTTNKKDVVHCAIYSLIGTLTVRYTEKKKQGQKFHYGYD